MMEDQARKVVPRDEGFMGAPALTAESRSMDTEVPAISRNDSRSLSISGLQVEFPLEPYDVQVSFMKKAIEAMQGKKNALLESPTGTGKTLCLLCSTLAWQASEIQANKHKVAAEPKLEPRISVLEYSAGVSNAVSSNDIKPNVNVDQNSLLPPVIIYASRTLRNCLRWWSSGEDDLCW